MHAYRRVSSTHTFRAAMLAVLMEYQTATIALRMKVKAATIDVLVIVSDATITLPTNSISHIGSQDPCVHIE